MIATIGVIAGKALIGMLMKLATEAFFKDILLLVADMAVKSTETKYDDKLLSSIKEALGEDK